MQALGEAQLDRAIAAQKKNFVESLAGISKGACVCVCVCACVCVCMCMCVCVCVRAA